MSDPLHKSRPPSKQRTGTTREYVRQEIERRKSGRGLSTNPWLRYELCLTEYGLLEPYLQTDGFLEDR
jgi:hypothetical protein